MDPDTDPKPAKKTITLNPAKTKMSIADLRHGDGLMPRVGLGLLCPWMYVGPSPEEPTKRGWMAPTDAPGRMEHIDTRSLRKKYLVVRAVDQTVFDLKVVTS